MPGMRRREFVSLFGGAAAAWPLAARAQQPANADHRFSWAGDAFSAWPMVRAFVQRLRELGWIEGRTVAIEYRWAEGRASASPRSRPSSSGSRSMSLSRLDRARRGKAGDNGNPDRLRMAGDPVGSGLVASLAHRAATSPACRLCNRPMWLASDSNCCARLSPVSAGWRSWPMSAVPCRVEMGEAQSSGPHVRP